MALDARLRAALNAARAQGASRRKAENAERYKVAKFMRARQRAERQFKRGLAERLLAASGLDQVELKQRLEQDRRAVERFLVNRKAEARRAARVVRKRHRDLAKAHIGRMTRLAPPPAPNGASAPVIDISLTAVGIEIEGTDRQSSAAGPYNNIGKALLYHDDHVSGITSSVGSFRFATITWFFGWSPPRDGELDVAAFLFLSGHRYLFCEPGCLSGGSAGADANAILSITQTSPDGTPFTDSSAPFQYLSAEVHKDADESTGQIDAGAIDRPDVVTSDRSFVVVGPNPVIASVELALRVDCRQSQSEIDLYTGDFAANMPAVVFKLF